MMILQISSRRSINQKAGFTTNQKHKQVTILIVLSFISYSILFLNLDSETNIDFVEKHDDSNKEDYDEEDDDEEDGDEEDDDEDKGKQGNEEIDEPEVRIIITDDTVKERHPQSSFKKGYRCSQ
jgi:cobalamin biosynthesis protein CobT